MKRGQRVRICKPGDLYDGKEGIFSGEILNLLMGKKIYQIIIYVKGKQMHYWYSENYLIKIIPDINISEIAKKTIKELEIANIKRKIDESLDKKDKRSFEYYTNLLRGVNS